MNYILQPHSLCTVWDDGDGVLWISDFEKEIMYYSVNQNIANGTFEAV
jgi:hypothetical protein